jgi:hypothetical protein
MSKRPLRPLEQIGKLAYVNEGQLQSDLRHHKLATERERQARENGYLSPTDPDQEDFDKIEAVCGPMPPCASGKLMSERYRLARTAKLKRLYGSASPAVNNSNEDVI